MIKKLTIISALAAVGFGAWLGYAALRKPSCASWHNMKIVTNEDKILQNKLSRENGWNVELTNFDLPSPITKMTVEVCKICGKPVAISYETK